MKRFYYRRVAEEEVLTCLQCERDTKEPTMANRVNVLRDDDKKLLVLCLNCGAMETLKS